MTPRCCDLHMHSTHSDGTMTPRELVLLAKESGLSAVALTDHDTTSGMAEMQEAGRELGVRVLSGVEISVDYAGKTVHMLGYCFDTAGEHLQNALDELVRGRTERNHEIVRKLQGHGIDICYDEVVAESGGKVVGRPHFAAVLLRKGAVENWQQAFDEYLASGAKAYVDRLKFSPEDSVRMIRDAGGVAGSSRTFPWEPGRVASACRSHAPTQLKQRLRVVGHVPEKRGVVFFQFGEGLFKVIHVR